MTEPEMEEIETPTRSRPRLIEIEDVDVTLVVNGHDEEQAKVESD